MDSGWMAVWPVAAFFLGGVATQVTGWLNHRRQRAERAADDAAAVEQRREEFELSHLVELNRLLQEYADTLPPLVAALTTYWSQAPALSDTERGEIFPREVYAATEAAGKAVRSQIGFVLDDDARRIVDEAYVAIDMAASDILINDDGPNLGQMGAAVNLAHEALSARVREIYAGQAPAR
ncbi:hypothetical protein ACFWIP_17170 [Streptomyces anulatus]|uniref:hypothetical protein n=1 Tax=Streptomyces anulatus TaxID=1892 RepID=UPI00364B4B49